MTDIVIPRKGQIVETKVVKVDHNVIYLDLNFMTEGTIYLNEYDIPAPTTFEGLIKVGDTVRAKIMKISEGDESSIILLSRLPLIKELKLNILKEKYESKEVIKGMVKEIKEKGLIVSYEGYDLFLPFSLLDFDLINKTETLLNKELEVVIEEFKVKPRLKLIASRKPIFERLRQEAFEKRQEARKEELDAIQTGDIITGTVERLEPHAAAIKFDAIVGMLRISQISHYRIDKITDVLKLGEKVEVKVIKKEGNRLDLSMKALQKTPFELFAEENKKGMTVKGKVVQKLPFGLIIEVAKDVKGLLHKSEYSWNPEDNFDDHVKINDEVEVAILGIDKGKGRIQLSRKSLEHNPWNTVEVKRGDKVEVLITDITNEGIVVAFEGVDGLIPSNEVSVENLKIDDHFAVNDKVEAIVTDFNKSQWILKLSIKRLQEALEKASYEKYLNDEEEVESITLGDLFEDLKK